jgi:hypothetical protein
MNFLRCCRHTIVCCAFGLGLTGCGHMPVTSMVKLARVDFDTTDPAGLRVAVKLPTAIRPLRDQVRLRLSVKLASGVENTQDFQLKEMSDAADVLLSRGEIEAGTHIFAYRLDAVEANRLAAFRDDLKQKQAASGGRSGAITISIVPETCRSGEFQGSSALFTTYLRTPETGNYVPLARDVDVQSLMRGRDLLSEMPICGQAG